MAIDVHGSKPMAFMASVALMKFAGWRTAVQRIKISKTLSDNVGLMVTFSGG